MQILYVVSVMYSANVMWNEIPGVMYSSAIQFEPVAIGLNEFAADSIVATTAVSLRVQNEQKFSGIVSRY